MLLYEHSLTDYLNYYSFEMLFLGTLLFIFLFFLLVPTCSNLIDIFILAHIYEV